MRLLPAFACLALALAGCGGMSGNTEESLTVSPKLAAIARSSSAAFSFTYKGSGSGGVVWSTNGGSVSQAGAYKSPDADGVYEVTVTSLDKPGLFDKAVVAVGDSSGGTMTPSELSLGVGESCDLSVAFTGVSDQSADWLSTGGSFSSASGEAASFTAPASAGTVTVVARNKENPFLFGKLGITVATISVSVSPDGLAVSPGSVQAFTASVTGAKNTEVTWEASGGTITPDGSWTAPAASGIFTITARSRANAKAYGQASIIVR